jgi:hypothetical protein
MYKYHAFFNIPRCFAALFFHKFLTQVFCTLSKIIVLLHKQKTMSKIIIRTKEDLRTIAKRLHSGDWVLTDEKKIKALEHGAY